MPNTIWKTYSLKAEDDPLYFELGALRLWIKRDNDEFWIAYKHEQDHNAKKETEDDLKWARWAPKSDEDLVNIKPVFPDKPLMVSSEFPLKIAPGAKIQIYTRIPVWLEISLGKSEYKLIEIPNIKLSRTWFGNTREGELCYWSTTKARRNLSEVENKPYVINCPIWITNKDTKDLDFDKFCFRVERLGIFLTNNELWADETRIVYHGEELNSDITMTGKLPASLGKAERMNKPRNPESKSFTTRTFKRLF